MDSRNMSRRQIVAMLGAAGVSSLLGTHMTPAQTLMPAVDAVDHLLLGISDLDKGITWVEKLTGVKAAIGGSHPGVGTRNALLSLGGRRYLEIIAPDPAQTAFNSRHDVRKLTEPRLMTWAAGTKDIGSLAKRAAEGGRQIFGPRDGSRARPDGKMIRWKTLGIMHQLGSELLDPIPFFIEWAPDAIHPSQDSPSGCMLQSFTIQAPNASRIVDELRRLGIDAPVKEDTALKLVATLKTPKGPVTLE
jgi:hypothetical protein